LLLAHYYLWILPPDYRRPTHDASIWEITSNPVPTKRNPLGAKGAGEAGMVGALPVIVS